MLKHYVYIHPAFHPNGAMNLKSMERNSFIFLIEYGFYHTGLKKKTDNHSKNCTEIFYIKSK